MQSSDPDPNADTQSSSSSPEYPSEGYSWYFVTVLMIFYVVSFLDRQLIGLLIAPIKEDLDLSDTQIGMLLGFAFAFLYAILGFPLGRLADRVNRKYIIGIGMFFWSIMTAGTALARSFFSIFLFRMGVGVGEASLSPAAYSMITDTFPPDKLGRAFSVYSAGIYFGAGFSLLVGGQVIVWVSNMDPVSLPLMGELRPWQTVFLIVGIIGMFPLVLLATIKEPKRHGVKVHDSGKPKQASVGEVAAYIGKNWKTFFFHHMGFAALAFSSYGVGNWGVEFMRRVHGWDVPFISRVFALHVIVCGVAGIFIGGYLMDYLSKKGYTDSAIRVGLLASILWIPTGIFYPIVANPWLAWSLMAVSFFFVAFPIGAAAAAVQKIVPNDMRGQASALYLFTANLIGLGIGPVAVGLLTDRVFHDEMKLGYSMLIVGVGAHILAIVSFSLGMKPFRESVAYLKKYNENH
ncbi:MAG: MFS transporter [Candidatus Hydrogenedentota bacterium]|nr:MAG: MFS transporter [Candidatus Hydrogenedentota bacterium]